jgi:hypothetical protein
MPVIYLYLSEFNRGIANCPNDTVTSIMMFMTFYVLDERKIYHFMAVIVMYNYYTYVCVITELLI